LTLIGGLDLETTGVKTDTDRIVEVALIVQDLDTGAEKLRYVRRINPEMHISAKALAVHGITDADVLGCPTFKLVAPLLVKVLEKVDLIVGHNVDGFDMVMLIHEFLRAGITKVDLPPSFDTMLALRGATADGKFPTLGELAWALDVPYNPEQAHGAGYDVEVTLAAFRNGLKFGQFKRPAMRAAFNKVAA